MSTIQDKLGIDESNSYEQKSTTEKQNEKPKESNGKNTEADPKQLKIMKVIEGVIKAIDANKTIAEVREQVVTSPELKARTRREHEVIILELFEEAKQGRRGYQTEKQRVLRSWGNDDRNCI